MDGLMKRNDPAIDLIREIRHQISAEFGHDPRKVFAYYLEFEEKLLRERFLERPRARPEGA